MPAAKPVRPRTPPQEPPEVVDPRWILKAAGAVVALGLCCAYLTLCLFFYNGQWQFVLQPSRVDAVTPAAKGIAFTPVRFGTDLSGQPQLNGWWIPGDSAASPTALLLHSETGAMSDALPIAEALHDARLNVLLFDYRGYGQSAGRHPTEAMMEHDTDTAFQYLVSDRGISAAHVIPVGLDLGASLATQLSKRSPQIPALILIDADGDTLSRVQADQRSRLIPIRLLFHERFPLADTLATLNTPKLMISFTRGNAPLVAERAADPKTTTELAPGTDPAALTPVIRRFLGTYVAQPPSLLN